MCTGRRVAPAGAPPSGADPSSLCVPLLSAHRSPPAPARPPYAYRRAGIAATANWVSNAVVAQTFLSLTRRLGGSGAFYLYCGIAAAGGLWTHRFLPETNGLSLEQVQQLFGGGDAGGGAGGGLHAGASGGGGWPWGARKRRGSDDGPEFGAVAAAGVAGRGAGG